MRAYRQRRSTLGTLLLMAAVAAPALGEGVRVTVVPAAASVPLGGDRRLTAYVNGSASTAVVWSVNGIAGGSSLVGTIDAAGK